MYEPPYSPDTLLSHQKIMESFVNDYKNNRLSHAYMCIGPKGIGKFSIIFEFSKLLLGVDNPYCSPDFIVINKLNDQKIRSKISVDQIRDLESFLRLTAAGLEYRIAIINNASEMTHGASNALLKILEEPGERTIIFLIVDCAHSLAPSILSRCAKSIFGDISNEDKIGLIRRATNYKIEREVCSDILKVSHGNVDIATSIYNEDALEIVEKTKSCFFQDKKEYINDIVQFGIKSQKTWEIVSYLLSMYSYELIKLMIKNKALTQHWLNIVSKLNKLLYDCEIINLDRGKVITVCLTWRNL
jgi:DNA polymerase-3 subunit delta'